ncbi:MAG: filamentous hemagglutinin N-terminal domain-containing protein [Rhizobiales bacterium]|nr:filamentous hemagglutinin N-terminal domain-containing protein [Hyphomicrobiales bacterium]
MTMTAMAALMVLSRPALAGPVGGTVVDGTAAISQAGAATNINQSTNKAIINWQGFSVGANESVNFYQPGASSVTLNRVVGNETSVINGAINANGQVFIVNSAGVLFGKGSQVNVGGLVASTHDISNSDFMAGNYTFSGTSNAAVVNQGRIRAHDGGYVALLGKTVSNDGVISARLGTVAMSAGEKLTLNFEGNSLLDVTIDKGTLNALVENKRAIRADGGRVILTARAADQLLAAQVNNTGIVQARTVAALKGGSAATGRKGRRTTPKADPQPEIDPAGVPMAQGTIKIYAYGGAANIAGTLDASAPKGGDGGFIETSGDHVKIADSVLITTKSAYGKTGTWLIDPTDFTIVAGSGAQTASGIGATTLVNNLATSNVNIETAAGGSDLGDINVNAALSWTSGNSLTLTAYNDVNVNAPITWGAGTLSLNAYRAINIKAPLTGSWLELGAYNFNTDTYGVINVDAVNALNVTTIGGQGGTYAQSLNINQAQTWTTAPIFSTNMGLVDGININAPVTWAGTFEIFGALNINAGGSLNGSILDSQYGMTLNLNASNALNVASITGWSIFNINQSQVWTTVPDMSTVNTTGGGFNINAALSWSAGTLAIGVGDINVNQPQSWGSAPGLQTLNGNINVNAAINWSAGTLTLVNGGGATKAININAPMTGSSLSLLTSGSIAVGGPVTLSGALSLSGSDIAIDAAINANALKLAATGNVAVNATNGLNVQTISGIDVNSVVKSFTINAAQAWSNAPTVSLPGDIIVNGPLSWTSGTLTLKGSGDVSINTPWISSGGGLTVEGANINFNVALSRSASTTASASGDINVNGPISWSAGTLTLNAGKNINVNSVMSMSGTASLAANSGTGSNSDGTPFGLYMGTDSDGNYAGRIDLTGNGTVALNGQAYTVINSLSALGAIAGHLSGNYVLGRDIAGLSMNDLSSFLSAASQISGKFDGFGHKVASSVQSSISLPSSIPTLKSTNLVLSSSGTVSIPSSVTSGAGILTLNAPAFDFAASATLRGTNIVLNGAINSSSNNTWELFADRNLYINGAVTLTGDSAGLLLNAGRDIYINNAVALTGANAKLELNYGGYNGSTVTSPAAGTDYYIRTRASYAGAVIDPATGYPVAQVDPHDPAKGGDGVYGSITFSNSANTNGLKINGQTYTLIHDIGQLDLLDKADSLTGLYYNPNTGLYDASMTPVAGYIDARKPIMAIGKYYNPATNNWDIAQTSTAGTCGSATCYYNPVSKLYDLTSAYVIPSNNNNYYYDPTTGKYTIAMYDGTNYYDPVSRTYMLTSPYTSNMVYDPASGNYVAQRNAANQYYNQTTGNYQSASISYAETFYYNPTTGILDLTARYVAPRGNYALAQNFDLSGSTYVTSLVGVFSGTLAGLGHTVSNLTINAPTSYYIGLIGQTDKNNTNVIRDIGVVNATITGYQQVGALLGQSLGATISHAYSTGTVTATDGSVGGLIGGAQPSGNAQRLTTIVSSFSDANVTAAQSGSAGGLIGFAVTDPIIIANSHATGNVKSGNDVPPNEFTASDTGGLIGIASFANIGNSYATGNISAAGGQRVGGLVGSIYLQTSPPNTINNAITGSFATGNVVGGTEVGGLVGNVGYLSNGGVRLTIDNAYATGNVTGTYNTANSIGGRIGGLVGSLTYGTITNSHATGAVGTTATRPSSGMGSLVGFARNSKVTDSYATGTVTGNGGSGTGGLVGNPSNLVTSGNSNHDVRVEAAATAQQAAAEAAARAATEAAIQAAEQAAFQAAGAHTGSTAATGGDVASSGVTGPTTAAAMSAMQQSAKLDGVNDGLKQTEQTIRSDDKRHEQRRKAAVAAANRAASAPRGPSYRGTIRSIDVDGQRFELERDGTPNSGGGNSGAPASGGGAQ